MDRAGRWIFCGFFLGIPTIFYVIGMTELWREVRAFRDVERASAVVVPWYMGDVEEEGEEGVDAQDAQTGDPSLEDSGAAPGQPIDQDAASDQQIQPSSQVAYRYTVDGVEYEGDQNLFMVGTPLDDFKRVYTPGETVEIWYSRADPSRSYIVMDIDAAPVLMTVFVLPFWLMGLGAFNMMKPAEPVARPAAVGNGWYALRLGRTRGDALWTAWTLVMVTMISGGGLYMFGTVAPVWSMMETLIATLLWGAVMVAMLAWAGWCLLAFGAGRDPVVLVRSETVEPGGELSVRVEQRIGRSVKGTLEVGLRCRVDSMTRSGGKQSYSTSVSHDSWQLSSPLSSTGAEAALDGTAVGRRDVAVCEGVLRVPSDARRSWAGGAGPSSYPRHTWGVQVRTNVRGADFFGVYGLVVGGEGAGAGASGSGDREGRDGARRRGKARGRGADPEAV